MIRLRLSILLFVATLVMSLTACASGQAPSVNFEQERHRGSVGGWLFLVQPDGHVRVFGDNLCLIVASEYRYAVNVPVQERYTEESCAGSTLIQGLNNIVGVSAGDDFLLAVDKDGYLWALGNNDRGQMGFSSEKWIKHPTKFPELGKIKDFFVYGNIILLTEKGDVLNWIANNSNCKHANRVWKDFVADHRISIESVFSGGTAISKDGKVFSLRCGKNTVIVQIDVPCHVVSMDNSPGYMFVCRNGDVYAMGGNTIGQLAMGRVRKVDQVTKNKYLSNIVKISGHNIRIAMTSDGQFYGWGDQRQDLTGFWVNTGYVWYPTRMRAPKGVTNFFSYSSSIYFLLEDGRVAQLIPEKHWFFSYKNVLKDYYFRYYKY